MRKYIWEFTDANFNALNTLAGIPLEIEWLQRCASYREATRMDTAAETMVDEYPGNESRGRDLRRPTEAAFYRETARRLRLAADRLWNAAVFAAYGDDDMVFSRFAIDDQHGIETILERGTCTLCNGDIYFDLTNAKP